MRYSPRLYQVRTGKIRQMPTNNLDIFFSEKQVPRPLGPIYKLAPSTHEKSLRTLLITKYPHEWFLGNYVATMSIDPDGNERR